MGKKPGKIQFPDGTIFEVSPDMDPEQIVAIIQALRQKESIPFPKSNEPIPQPQSPEEIWEFGSKKDKLALFIRNHFSPTYWFTVTEIRDQQLIFIKKLVFGESPAIHTYLKRLFEEGYVERRKRRKLEYKLTEKILTTYPEIELHQMSELFSKHP